MVNNLYQRLSQIYYSDKFPWVIICIGIILRLARYLHNPSLYFDEAGTATDIIERPISDLINISPDATSTYPFSFLIITKIAIQILGNSEYAFRLFPMLFGILSLLLFYYVAKHYVSPNAVPAALSLFAILDSPVYYSSIVKPYSGDIFFALLLFALLVRFRSKDFSLLHTLLLALTGTFVIWFSNSSVFVLAGIGTSLLLFYFIRKEWAKIGWTTAASVIWAMSFIIYYVIYINNAAENLGYGVEDVLKWEYAFLPFPPRSLADIKWFIDAFFDTFNFADSSDFNHGLTLTSIGALFFLTGCIKMYSYDKEKFITLISPIFFTLAAAAFHKYPFRGRLILFLIPFFLFVMSEGIDFIHSKTKNHSKAIFAIVVIFLFIYPVSWAAYHIKKPVSREEIKPIFQYIKNNWQKGDILYVHFYAQYAFDYYAKHHTVPLSFIEDEYIIGIAPRGWYNRWRRDKVSHYYDMNITARQSSTDILNVYIKDLDRLRGHKRAWILFAGGISSTKGIRDSDFFLFHLDGIGKRLDSIQDGASAYLYDLSGQP